VHDLVRVASDIRTSVLKNPLEKIEQSKCYDVLMRMVATLVSLDRLDKTKLQMIFVKQRTNFVLPLRKEAQVFSNGLLGNCLKSGVKSIFARSYADNLFWTRQSRGGIFSPIFVDVLNFNGNLRFF